jgi:hypothetical protein
MATMFNVQPKFGFNVSPPTTPGFRVGLSEDLPGFSVDQNGSVRLAFAGNSNGPGFSYGSYGNSPGPLGLDPVTNPYTSVERNPVNTTDVSGLLAFATPQWPNSTPPFPRLPSPFSSPLANDGSGNASSLRQIAQEDSGGADNSSPAKDPIIPVADVPSAANDNPVCNHAYGRCVAAARRAGLPWKDYTAFIQDCKTVYDLCLHRENDPQRIGRDGDFFDLPDGGHLVFRRGKPPQYIPSPSAPPVRPYIPPDYNDPTQF